MIPFAYSHLVSFGSFSYLLFLAVAKAVRFTPEADYLSGLVLPCASFAIMTITAIGLIEIGQAISDPWGNDPEDFAVPRFLHATAKMTRLLIEHDIGDPLDDAAEVNMGNVDLRHVPLEGQSRVRRHIEKDGESKDGDAFSHALTGKARRTSFTDILADQMPKRRRSVTAAAGSASSQLLNSMGFLTKEQRDAKLAAAKIQAIARGRSSRRSIVASEEGSVRGANKTAVV